MHANSALTVRHRLKVAQLVVDDGWPISEVAARFQVSWPTVKRWADRYLAGEAMQDRSSRPHRRPRSAASACAYVYGKDRCNCPAGWVSPHRRSTAS